jgi:kojibiose phosphorylase
LIASKAGLPNEAYRYFMEASTIDLYNASKKVMSGGEFLGGIHTAANGGVWLILVRGFAGFEMDGETVVLKSAVPEQWESLTFKLMIRGNELTICMDHEQVSIRSSEGNPGDVAARIDDRSMLVRPGCVEVVVSKR